MVVQAEVWLMSGCGLGAESESQGSLTFITFIHHPPQTTNRAHDSLSDIRLDCGMIKTLYGYYFTKRYAK